MDVSTPLNVSDLKRVLEKDESTSTDVCTPMRLAVVPDINSELYTHRQCTGSVAPLAKAKLLLLIIYLSKRKEPTK